MRIPVRKANPESLAAPRGTACGKLSPKTICKLAERVAKKSSAAPTFFRPRAITPFAPIVPRFRETTASKCSLTIVGRGVWSRFVVDSKEFITRPAKNLSPHCYHIEERARGTCCGGRKAGCGRLEENWSCGPLKSLHDHSVSPGGRIDPCRRSARRRLRHPYKKPPLTAIDARAADDGSETDDSVMVQWPIPEAPVLMNQDSSCGVPVAIGCDVACDFTRVVRC